MHKMEWYGGIKSQTEFMGYIENLQCEPDPGCNYEQAARLFFEGSIAGKPDRCVMVELQVPTSASLVLEDGSTHGPWLSAFEVNNIGDYDASTEIFRMWREEEITYDNAEWLMLSLAKDLCD